MFVQSHHAKLFALQHGPRGALPIMAIGGWIGSSELWVDPLALLSDEYSTLTYDHRGSGLSVCDASSITFDALVADALAVMDVFGLSRCVLAAESAGAQTALALAARHPDRVSHLIIVDGMYSRGVAVDNDPFLQGLHAAYPATLERFVQLCIPELDCDHIKNWGRKILARADPSAAIALRILGSDTDVTSDIRRIAIPTLVLHGDRDKIVPLESAQALVAALPDAQLHVLQGCGHVPTLTRPREVADAIRSFLRQRSHHAIAATA